MSPEEFKRLQPFVALGERLGTFVAQMNDDRVHAVSVRYYGELAAGPHGHDRQRRSRRRLQATPLDRRHAWSTPARVAAERGIEVVESHSTRTRNYTSLISVKLRTSAR